MSPKLLHKMPGRPSAVQIAEPTLVANRAALNARLVEWVGTGRRVLSLATCPADLRRELEHNGCQVEIDAKVPGLDRLDLRMVRADDQADLPAPSDPYDAILAEGALASAIDPHQCLEAVKAQLSPHGALFIAFDNATHARHRLAMIRGEITADLTPTHRPSRTWSFANVTRLLEDAGFAVGNIARDREPLDPALFDRDTRDLAERWKNDADAMTVRYLIAAYPLPATGLAWLQQRMRHLSERAEAAECDNRQTRDDLENLQRHLAELLRLQDDAGHRERELRDLNVHAHAHIASRDAEVHHLSGRLGASEQLSHQRAMHIENLKCELADLRARCEWFEFRFGRLRSSLPGKVFRRLKRVVSRVRG